MQGEFGSLRSRHIVSQIIILMLPQVHPRLLYPAFSHEGTPSTPTTSFKTRVETYLWAAGVAKVFFPYARIYLSAGSKYPVSRAVRCADSRIVGESA